MKAISLVLVLIFGITTLTMAQEADSIVVTYDNQRTIIPVPSFGKQTTIKMADSVQLIEIGVSRRKLSDIVQPEQYPSNTVTAEKPLKKEKWFSQVEAGYTSDFVSADNNLLRTFFPYRVFVFNTDNLKGYKLGLTVHEKEKYFNNKFSYVSGFKFGFAQSYRAAKSTPNTWDTINQYIWYNPMTISKIQLLFPFGFSYHFTSGKFYGQINLGANIGTSIEFSVNKYSGGGRYSSYDGAPIMLQPYVGFEIEKIGILVSSGFTLYPNYYSFPDNTLFQDFKSKVSLGLSLTYRLF